MAEKQSSVRKMLSEACIAQFYQKTGWNCRVYPVFTIDKVHFSFFKVATVFTKAISELNKKEGDPYDPNEKIDAKYVDRVKKSIGTKRYGFEVYVDTDDFAGLCDSIKNLLLYNNIANDHGKYPSAWIHNSGVNGQKKVALGKGMKGIILHGSAPNKEPDKVEKYAFFNAYICVENYQILLSMAYMYDLVSGRAEAFGYYKMLRDLFFEGADQVAKNRYQSLKYSEAEDDKTIPEETPETIDEIVKEQESKQPAGSSEKAHVNSSKGTANKPQNKPTKPPKEPLNMPVKPPAGKISTKVYHGRFNTTTDLFDDGKGLYYVGIEPVSTNLRDGHERYLIFPRESMKNIPKDQFFRLQRDTKGKSIILSVNYFNGKNEKQLLFSSFNND